MKLIDAIEAWGVEHRSDLSDTELRRLGTFWATLSNSDIGDRPIAFLTDGDADQAAGLFTWTDKSDVLELLDTVRAWHLRNVAATAPPDGDPTAPPVGAVDFTPPEAPTLAAAPSTPSFSPEIPDSSFGFDDADDDPLPGARLNPIHTGSPIPTAEDAGASDEPKTKDGRDRGDIRLLQLGALLLVAIVLVGVVITVGFGDSNDSTSADTIATGADSDEDTNTATDTATDTATNEVLGSTLDAPAAAEAPVIQAPTLEPEPAATPESYPPLESLPERQAVLRDGKLYLEGPQPNQAYADAVAAKAIEVMGPDNVVNNYVIHPDAPPPTDGSILIEQGVFFGPDSAIIQQEFIPVLELGVILLNLNPGVTMLIEGHTDADGDPDYNRGLSLDRANSVADWIAVNGTIDRTRFETRGYGADQPLTDNDTEAGKAANRRIEVKLFGLLGG